MRSRHPPGTRQTGPVRPPPELIEFTVQDRRSVLTVMRRQLQGRDGWVNLQPAVDPDDVPPRDSSNLTKLFSAIGPTVPLGSWVPGPRRRNGTGEPVSVGLQHAGGPKAILRLRERGHPPVAGWRVLADHPRRGFVLAVPDDEDPDTALVWLLRAAELLAPMPLPAVWHAGVIHRR
jgi:hypothetical protein